MAQLDRGNETARRTAAGERESGRPGKSFGDMLRPLIDSHVHVYGVHDVPTLLDAAFRNFTVAAQRLGIECEYLGVLMLAETAACDWFQTQLEKSPADGGNTAWRFHCLSGDPESLLALSGGRRLLILPGRQIVSAEGLEVLALLTRQRFQDGKPLSDLLGEIHAAGAVPVIPWGVGKWLGKRGKVLSEVLQCTDVGALCFYLGDNGGRPVFWRRPRHFREAESRGIKILPGTDPLPLAWDSSRVGTFGFTVPETISLAHAAADLRALLCRGGARIEPFGNLERPYNFFRNQLALRFRKSRAAAP